MVSEAHETFSIQRSHKRMGSRGSYRERQTASSAAFRWALQSCYRGCRAEAVTGVLVGWHELKKQGWAWKHFCDKGSELCSQEFSRRRKGRRGKGKPLCFSFLGGGEREIRGTHSFAFTLPLYIIVEEDERTPSPPRQQGESQGESP